MGAKVIALYGKPLDAGAFDQYYFGKHVPLAKTLPGLKRYEVNDGPATDMSGAAPYHLAAMLSFDSVGDVQTALTSEAGKATAADLSNFATGGVSLLMFQTKDV